MDHLFGVLLTFENFRLQCVRAKPWRTNARGSSQLKEMRRNWGGDSVYPGSGSCARGPLMASQVARSVFIKEPSNIPEVPRGLGQSFEGGIFPGKSGNGRQWPECQNCLDPSPTFSKIIIISMRNASRYQEKPKFKNLCRTSTGSVHNSPFFALFIPARLYPY